MSINRGNIATIREIVEYGLDNIDSKEKIELSVKDFAYLYKTIVELRRFLHNKSHYSKIEDVNIFADGADGMYGVVNSIYSELFERIIDERIQGVLDDDELESPKFPEYYLE